MTLLELMNSSDVHHVELNDAIAMTAAYRANNPGARLGGLFGGRAILAILAQTGCTGIRYYFAEDAESQPTIVLVGVDSNDDDMTDGRIADLSIPNPPRPEDPPKDSVLGVD